MGRWTSSTPPLPAEAGPAGVGGSAMSDTGRPVLVVDNFDSFVYNLVQYLRQPGVRCIVRRNDAVTVDELPDLDVAGVLLSPGPGTPAGAGVTVPMARAGAGAPRGAGAQSRGPQASPGRAAGGGSTPPPSGWAPTPSTAGPAGCTG